MFSNFRSLCSSVLAASVLLGTSIAAFAAPDSSVSFPRFPALSPDGKTLVFSYQGDLWSVPSSGTGNARRLTAHPAYDGPALFSPDGKQIAFTSDRNGRDEVFVMPADGGEPRRLTDYSGGTGLQGWSADGKSVMVSASRELVRRGPAYYMVGTGAKPGRMKPVLTVSSMIGGALSPDGSQIVFAKGSGDWQRRGYHGAANSDIWVYNTKSKAFKQLTEFDGEDLWAMWLPGGKQIVYVSERDGTYNLYKLDVATGKTTEQLTHYKGDGVRLPSISADGSMVAFEVGDKIATLALKTPNAQPKVVPLTVDADDKISSLVTETKTSGASEMAATQDGEQMAIVIQGDIFVVGKEGGKATRITDAPEREDDVTWSPDGKTLLYVSNHDGNPEIYSVTSADPGEARLSRSLKRTVKRVTKTPERESNAQFSPDGKKVAFVRGKGNLMIADASDIASAKPLLTGRSLGSYTWSPDGRWIAFAQEDEEFNSEIFIVASDGSTKPVNVSKHPRNDYTPAWAPDGSKLFWTSERNDRQNDLYYVYLRKDDDERTADEWAQLREKQKGARPARPATAATPAGGDTPAPTTTPKAPEPTAIDFDGIDERVRRLTSQIGNESGPVTAPGADGHIWIAYRSSGLNGESELSLLDFVDGSERAVPRRLAAGGAGNYQWTKDGKTLLYLGMGGSLASASPTGGEARSIAYRARTSYDRRALQAATFNEAWDTLNEQFYDPKFHGADWAAMRAKYGPMAASASDAADFYDVIRLMMGHLNSSHIGISGGTLPYATDSIQTGALGVVWDEAYTGPGLKVGRVIKRSPADRASSKIKPGEVILAINGQTITPDTDPDVLLADTVGERTLLQISGTDGKTREMVIEPASYASVRSLLYDDWVEQRRDLTHKLSNGKLGYLHIQGMNKPSQDKFEQGLYSEAYGKDALLIDVRDNGGGSTADYLLTMLTIPRHAYTIPRDGEPGYPQDRLPLYPWNKPAGLLINQNSYSNAEIFAHAFRSINRGPIIGVPTFGAVISTGARTLLDGSSVRTPGRGWYIVGSGVNEEHTGAAPDKYVDISPADEMAGRDPQLEAAVKLMLQQAKPRTLPAPQAAK